ncbi:MAG: DUF177 domain-containing protein [Trueperaceae bacterium]
MVARRDALVNLTSLLRSARGSDDEVVEEGLLEPGEEAQIADDVVLADPLEWSLTVRRTGGEDEDFLVDGSVRGTAVLPCRRCLTDARADVEAEFVYLMRHRHSDDPAIVLAEDDDVAEDVLEFGQPVVDFAPLLRQVFAIDVPLTALCREDCKGLSLDGVNLNEHPEAATPADQRARTPSPFAALEDLKVED